MRYRANRRPTDQRVTVAVGEAHFPAVIRNYSASGLALQGLPELVPGTFVQIHGRHGAWPARIVWARGGLHGLKFDRVMMPRDLARLNLRGTRSAGAGWPRGQATVSPMGYGEMR